MLVKIFSSDGIKESEQKLPFNLLKMLQQNNVEISAPCGGKGTCGKCRVEIEGVGSFLACQTEVSSSWLQDKGLQEGDTLLVRVPEQGKAKIATEGLLPNLTLAPLLNRGIYKHVAATIEDQRSDERRFEEETGLKIPFALLPQLALLMREERDIEFFFRQDIGEVTTLLAEPQEPLLGVAIDIGTTTLAAWLYDLETGENLGIDSMMNPQRSYGADVISRIEQIDKDFANLKAQSDEVCTAIARLTREVIAAGAYPESSVRCLSISGNTVMMHLLCQLNPTAISKTPFIPVSMSGRVIAAADLGIKLSGQPLCLLLPSISAYVGADITAGIIASELYPLNDKKRLLLDLGTNGEMVLATPEHFIACSTAAGPAFEAANISCGMSGAEGALDKVTIKDGKLTSSVIGHKKMTGICGSGLISAIAALLLEGVIDETGRFTDEPEDLGPDLAARLVEGDKGSLFFFDRAGGSIYLNQKDIRELQNAKAAVAAGVQRLLQQAGIEASDLDEILIAGGFGNFLAVEDAYTIGLLPSGAEDRTRGVGNTSGMGAIACMLNETLRQMAAEAARSVVYYELSADPHFTDIYIDSMIFPDY